MPSLEEMTPKQLRKLIKDIKEQQKQQSGYKNNIQCDQNYIGYGGNIGFGCNNGTGTSSGIGNFINPGGK